MKTVSTKLSKEDFEKFQEICNNDGKCISEGLRDLLKMDIEAYEEGLEIENKESQIITEPILEEKPRVVSHGKILDDYGNTVGTF
ncbi:hypothetical protein BD31_I1301 [Candidatus Nitrosopumilus salaria BD31]|uniref:Uncharacterized protein n=1 Tax=Candidatus Nitrosopumilus salarius BD31 TaxID=859350 RepID=I3D2W0_9ARCH|nr:hypothetical protein [Candidatus Nitrosopumilus salaria]EIJ66053.1 hypothetical protein BD31_I1301 [Candidatus Nitrosopumilus salaria BD31]